MKISVFGLVATIFLAAADAASNVTHGRGSPGCGKQITHIGEEEWNARFVVSGYWRAFVTYKPEKYDENTPQPLIMAFHGTGRPHWEFSQQTRFSKPGINPNMMVQYMRAFKRSWYGANNAEPWVDDFKFTEMALEHLMNNYCIDVDRVYLVGHTGGGGFANILACDPRFSRHFAAMALMGPTLYRDLDDDYCKNARLPMPILEAHGLQDPTSPYGGLTIKERVVGAIPPIPDWLKRWVRRNNCNPVPHQEYYVDKRITSEKYTCHGQYGFVEHIKAQDHGYYWMTAKDDLDISQRIMFFLQQQVRPGNLSIPLDSRGLFTTFGGNSSSSGNSTHHKDTFFPRPNVTRWDDITATRSSKTSSLFTTSSSGAISTASGYPETRNKTTTIHQDRPAHTTASTSSTRTFYASMAPYSSTYSTGTFYVTMPHGSSTSSTFTRTFDASPTNAPSPDPHPSYTDEVQACHN